MKTIKTRNGGQWTEARYRSFIISALRGASRRWGPKNQAMKNARVGYGKYKCAMCGKTFGPKEIAIDHIKPIIDPKKGFVSYDSWIDRCFIEVDGFQVLCKDCHNIKTNKEKEIAKKYKNKK